MPGGHQPPRVMDLPSQPLPPPPASLMKPKVSEVSQPPSSGHSDDTNGQLVAGSNSKAPTVLRSKSTRDVVALIFVLLMLPQGISCIVLTAYILSGSFKSFAGKVIAKHVLSLENGVEFNLEGITTTRVSYYRSKLVGEFLQLFSINSLILLICHYTLPQSSLQYLIVMAKSIIASKLVGSFASGSATYTSVVSANSNNPGILATTSTSQGQSGSQKLESKFLNNSLLNVFTGFSVVVAMNHFLRKWIFNLNFTLLVNDIISFYQGLLFPNESSDSDYNNEQLFKVMFTKSPLLASFNYLSSNKALYYSTSRSGTSRQDFISKALIMMLVKRFDLSERTCKFLEFLLRQSSNALSFAYLVLCIHVITLTISPYSNKFFFLKGHSQTLDHLSSLAPDISFGAFKRPMASGLKDPVNDMVLHVNSSHTPVSKMKSNEVAELKLSPQISASDAPLNRHITSQTLSAENFKTFCTMPSINKTSSTASKTGSAKASTERKRSNTSPFTTVVDRYFTIASQPIWSWLAAIKVLLTDPKYFAMSTNEIPQKEVATLSPLQESRLQLALYSLDESKAIFEVMDIHSFKVAFPNLSVRVNGIDWMLFELLTFENAGKDTKKMFLSIFALFPSYQFDIEFLENDIVLCRHSVRTKSNGTGPSCNVKEDHTVGTLKNSLMYTMSLLCDTKATFKKNRKDENKRVTDLRKQIETLKSKLHKLETKESNEGRGYSKIKGLQNAISQLENEIKEAEEQVEKADYESHEYEESYIKEETSLKRQAAKLESEIEELEKVSAELKSDLKVLQGEKHTLEAKYKKLEVRAQTKENELVKLNTEIKGFKKAVIGKIQYRQRKAQDRLNTMIPQILHEVEKLDVALAEFGVKG